MNHSGGQVAKKKDKMTRSVPQPVSQNAVKQIDPPAGGNKVTSVRQPTAEEKRLAEILHGNSDAEARKKMIEEIRNITGCTQDEVVVALHDCNDDMERAVTALLERDRNEDEDTWEPAGKKQEKKRKVQTAGKQTNDVPSQNDVREGDKEERKPSERREKRDKSDGGPRQRRDRAPRFQRNDAARVSNGGEDQPHENGDDFQNDDKNRSRSRRGRGASSSSRGRSAGGRSFRNSGAPSTGFGTWSNENAETSQSKPSDADKPIGSWGDAMEDWDNGADDWTGSLTESKVFTASTVHDESSSKAFSNSDLIADGDNNLFSSAQTQSLNEQVFAPASSLGGEPLTRTDAVGYQKQQQQQPYKDLQAGSSQNQLGQRINLADLMRSSTVGESNSYIRPSQDASSQYLHSSNVNSGGHLQSHFITAYAKEAEESIKSAVGIGGVMGRVNQAGQGLPIQMDQQANSDSAQRAKTKSRLPPPSKIPTTAVVMPGGSVPQLDVNCEFGFWDASGDSAFVSGSSLKLHSGSSALSQLQGLDSGVSSSVVGSHDQPRTNHFQNASQSDISPRQDSMSYNSSTQAQNAYNQQQRTSSSTTSVAASSAAKNSAMFSSTDFTSPYQASTAYKPVQNVGFSASSSNLSPASYQSGYSTSGTTAVPSSQSNNLYLSGASSQSTQLVSQASAVGSGVYQSQSSNKLLYSNTVPSYATDQTLFHSQQQPLITNSYGGQVSNLSYDPQSLAGQSYQAQPSSLGFQTSTGYSSKQPYTGTANASTSGTNLMNASSSVVNSMTDGFSKLGMKDTSQTGVDQQHYGRSTGASASGSGSTHTDSSSSVGTVASSVNSTIVSSAGTAASSLSTSRSSTAASTVSASKVPATAAGLASAVPLMQYNLVGQTGIPGIPLMSTAIGPQIYDEYSIMQQRAAMLQSGYYDVSGYQQTPTTLAGRDQSSIPTVMPYTVDTKMTGRVDANSPGSMSGNQQQQQQQQQQLAHQQAYLNPTIPPGYNLYYPAAANSMLAGGYYTNPAFLQLPTGTNAAAGVHLGGATNAQMTKYYPATATGFGDVNQQGQVQDYSKMYVVAPQSQTKAGSTGITSDLAAASYSKTHGQPFDKGTYHTGTPPPYAGAQAVTLATPGAAYRAQYGVPMMQHSQMVPHMQQDVSMRGGQQISGQVKATGNKYNATQFWTGN